jgi:branched-chain amino acid transport system ATP-binding protein
MSEHVLVLEGVAKHFGLVRVLESIDLAIARGERHALIGPNGAGKSTLFNLISGRFAPSRGSIRLEGQEIAGLPPHRLSRAGVGRSFQITHIFNDLTVRDNVTLAIMGRHGRRWSFFRRGGLWRTIDAETEALLADAGLAGLADQAAGSLPYSDQRALEICMTVATGAALVLLDEPTAGMSREETAVTIAFIRRMTEGRTLVLVEHDMDVVAHLADRVSVVAEGRILVTGTPPEVAANERVRAAYLGGHGP